MIRVKRAYDPPSPDDGERYLVDRLWPRGLSKSALQLQGWLRDLAPSDDLRRWFGHDPAKWSQFQERYRQELQEPGRQALLRQLAEKARDGTVTLVYSAQDQEHNNAVVLKQVLEEMLGAS
ncbi:MAG TPA: DUF488 domain-containing protein [Dehalococcoidia bacterium]|nr:DUF488 domain-containing protein [Dehalococcoidia bacterium]